MRATISIADSEPVAGVESVAEAGEPRLSNVPRVLGLLMAVLAGVGLMQSVAGLRAAPDFEAFGLLGEGVAKWQAFGFWSHLTGLVVGALHLAAGILALRSHRRAPLLASVYAGAAVLRVVAVVVLYYQSTAAMVRPFGKTELFGGHDVGVLLHSALLLGWAAMVVLLLNGRASRSACSR